MANLSRRDFLKRNLIAICGLFLAQIFAKLIRDNSLNRSDKINTYAKEARYYKDLAG